MTENLLYIKLNRTNYEYDVHAIVKAFYADKQVKVSTPESKFKQEEINNAGFFMEAELYKEGAKLRVGGNEYQWQFRRNAAEGEDTGEASYKAGFKAFLYKSLQNSTGKSLPWGNLTGIRPTKLAYGMLEEGRSEEEIRNFLEEKHFVSRQKAELSIDIARRERELLADVHYEGGYSLYIGIPFCPATCLYCSFTSYPIAAYRKRAEAYIDCVIKEIEYVSHRYAHKILDSVYIGGGTPTTLEAEQLDRLISALKKFFDFSAVKEFTVEAGRADSITEDKLKVLLKHGVGRISINPQTMKQETLDIIGRRATVEQVEEAYALARRLGFDNINMDIILGLPKETEADVQNTIDRIVKLAPDSLTVHSLAIKRASRLNQWILENGVSMLRNTDKTMEIAAEGAKRLGMEPYYLYRQKNMSGNFENVGYAKSGKAGLYNILIMEEKQTIVALGAGSITKLVLPDGRIERSENVKDVTLYLEKIDEMIERKAKLFSLEQTVDSDEGVRA